MNARKNTHLRNPSRGATTLTVVWRLFVAAVLSWLVFVNLELSRQKHEPLGPEQGGIASLQQDVSSLRERVTRDEQANAQLQADLTIATDKLKITQNEVVRARAEATKATDGMPDHSDRQTQVRTDLYTTHDDLRMARSEMGTLIARNHDEIAELRRLGERDYYEFTVTTGSGVQKLGGVQVELKNTDTKKNQFTISILADEKMFEKKDRSVDEPIFFYTSQSRFPVELVVNTVTNTTASGYISVPKGTASNPE